MYNLATVGVSVTLDTKQYENKLAGLESSSDKSFRKIADLAAGYFSNRSPQTVAGLDLNSYLEDAARAKNATVSLTKAMLGETKQAKTLGDAIRFVVDEYKNKTEKLQSAHDIISVLEKAYTTLQTTTIQSKNTVSDYTKIIMDLVNSQRILGNETDNIITKIGSGLVQSISNGASSVNSLIASVSTLIPKIQSYADSLSAINNNQSIISTPAGVNNQTYSINTAGQSYSTSVPAAQPASSRMASLYASAGRKSGMYNVELNGLRMTVRNLTKIQSTNIAKTSLMTKSWQAAAGAAKGLGNAAGLAIANIGLVKDVAVTGYQTGNLIYDKLLKKMDEAENKAELVKDQSTLNSIQYGQKQQNDQQKRRRLESYLTQARKVGNLTDKEYDDIIKRYYDKDSNVSGQAYQEARDRSEQKGQYASREEKLRRENERIANLQKKQREEAQVEARKYLTNKDSQFQNKYDGYNHKVLDIKAKMVMDDGELDQKEQAKINQLQIFSQKKLLDHLQQQRNVAFQHGLKNELKELDERYAFEIDKYKGLLGVKKDLEEKALQEKRKKDEEKQKNEKYFRDKTDSFNKTDSDYRQTKKTNNIDRLISRAVNDKDYETAKNIAKAQYEEARRKAQEATANRDSAIREANKDGVITRDEQQNIDRYANQSQRYRTQEIKYSEEYRDIEDKQKAYKRDTASTAGTFNGFMAEFFGVGSSAQDRTAKATEAMERHLEDIKKKGSLKYV